MMKVKKLIRQNRSIIAAALIVLAIFSAFFVADKAAAPAAHAHTVESIDEKVGTVLELTAASTATSALISAIPDDTATPIADKLADFSTYFLAVLSVLYLEKYLVTVTGYAAFSVLIPLALAALAIGLYYRPETMKRIAAKAAIFAAAIYLIVPLSVFASDAIYSGYEDSIQDTLSEAEQAAEDEDAYNTDDDDSESVLSWISNGTKKLTEAASNVLNRFIKALAVMIVTSCLIPVLVMLFLVWLTKLLLEDNTTKQILKFIEKNQRKAIGQRPE